MKFLLDFSTPIVKNFSLFMKLLFFISSFNIMWVKVRISLNSCFSHVHSMLVPVDKMLVFNFASNSEKCFPHVNAPNNNELVF